MNKNWILVIIIIVVIVAIIFYSKINTHGWFYPKYYENFFKVRMPAEHQILVKKGYERAKKGRIVIAGLCRGIGEVVGKNIGLCQAIGNLFNQYKIILFENDSKDNTRDIIKIEAKKDKNIILMDCGPDNMDCKFCLPDLYNLGSLSNNRMNKMAQLRNRYLDYIKKHYSDYDYLLVLDMDIKGYTNLDGIMHAIGKDDWDMIAVNGRTGFLITSFMYDALSYAKKEADVAKCRIGPSNYPELTYKLLKMNLDNQKNFIPIRSAFNGMCLYKIKSILDAKYKLDYCNEHIAFHDDIWKNGYDKFYIDPYWILYPGTQGSTIINAR